MVKSKICTRCGFESYIGDETQSAFDEGFQKGVDALQEELAKQMEYLWKFYKKDTLNRPMPSFLSACAMVGLIADEVVKNYKEQK